MDSQAGDGILSPEGALSLLGRVEGLTGRVRSLAKQAFAQGAVGIVDPSGFDLPAEAVPYHVDAERLDGDVAQLTCRLLADARRHNGVFLREGNPGLLCSHPTCGLTACPFAVAACLAASQNPRPSAGGAPDSLAPEGDGGMPDVTPGGTPDGSGAAASYVARWSALTDDSQRAFNLIVSPSENDFAGVVIVDDDYYLQELVSDTARLLDALGKTRGKKPRRFTLQDFIGFTEYLGKQGEGLPTHQLILIDHLEELRRRKDDPEFGYRFLHVVDRLGHIIDDTYVLLVGTEADVAYVLDQHDELKQTFGGHGIRLHGMSQEEVYRNYLERLAAPLENEVDSKFHQQFISYLSENIDQLPYRGRELSDYLAKRANSIGKLELPDIAYQGSVDDLLSHVVGLSQVKAAIRKMEQTERWRVNVAGAHGGGRTNHHMLFTGNPGTGKTMVARLIARLLHKIGVTRTGKFVEVSARDLIGKYVGHTDKQVHEVITTAKGGVLFIDEAYALAPNGREDSGFGKEAVAELVKSMEDYRDDLVVILAGYEREMKDFLDVNPGLASRIAYKFHFEDYTTDELVQIFDEKVARIGVNGLAKAEGVDEGLRETLGYFQGFANFGNGRFVERMVDKTCANLATRCAAEGLRGEGLTTITPADVPTRQQMLDMLDWKPRSAKEMLEPLVGMKTVKEQILRLEDTVSYRTAAARAGKELPVQNLNMLFTGNPGTGKTTVARIIGSVLFYIGAVPTDHFVEVQAKDLVSRVVGGTGDEVASLVERAMGGVLFIDEAYALMQTGSGEEALSTLIKYMGDNRGSLVVMFAGYRDEMRRFVDVNPGLASRIGYRFDFEDYEPEELNEIFRRKAADAGLELAEGTLDSSLSVFKFFHGVRDFGNGRFVDQVLQETIARKAARYARQADELASIIPEDIPTVDELAKTSSAEVYAPSDMGSDDALRRVALHEMGHAVVRLALTGGTDIVKVTVEQEGNGALGYVQHKGGSHPLPTRAVVRGEISSMLGGMAAEQLMLGDYSVGNVSDLEQATSRAFQYVAMNGMSEAGLVQYAHPERYDPPRMADLPQPVLDAMNRVMESCLQDAKDAIQAHRASYDALVEVVSRDKTISGERVLAVWNEHERVGEGE